MAKEYIDREALLKALKHYKGTQDALYYDEIKLYIDDTPTADVAPVVHGRWEKSEDDYYGLNIIKCSICREEWVFDADYDVVDLIKFHYCPSCGAKMDGGKEDE